MFKILSQGTERPREWNGVKMEKTFPSVVVFPESHIALGFHGDGKAWRAHGHRKERFCLLHAWRAMKLLDYVRWVSPQAMQACWGLVRNMASPPEYFGILEKQLENPHCLRKLCQELEPFPGELKHMLGLAKDCGLLLRIDEQENVLEQLKLIDKRAEDRITAEAHRKKR